MSGFDDEVRAALRSRKAALKMTYQQLAAATGIPRRTIKRYLMGEGRLYLSTAYTLATALGTTVDTIISHTERERAERAYLQQQLDGRGP